MQQTTVGTSRRTPFKHWLLDSQLGRIVGALSTGRTHATADPFHVIDLCAGDGIATEQSNSTSPAIIQKHCKFLLNKGRDVKATLIERDQDTYNKLVRNTPDVEWLETLHMDARDYVIPRQSRKQAIFINADPNAISDWPITERLLKDMTDTTTLLATLGCNVAGLKRLSIAGRSKWFDYVDMCSDSLPSYHDLLLIELKNDKSQWAYLLRLPSRWTEETALRLMKKGSSFATFEVGVISFKHSLRLFKEAQDRLFLTKKERGEK